MRTAQELVREQFAVIETGDLALADTDVTPDYVNHRSASEPLPILRMLLARRRERHAALVRG